ncbi:MAG: hypothetical protein AAB617_03085 [Patescibacteria group bacterium]
MKFESPQENSEVKPIKKGKFSRTLRRIGIAAGLMAGGAGAIEGVEKIVDTPDSSNTTEVSAIKEAMEDLKYEIKETESLMKIYSDLVDMDLGDMKNQSELKKRYSKSQLEAIQVDIKRILQNIRNAAVNFPSGDVAILGNLHSAGLEKELYELNRNISALLGQ